MSKGDAEKQKLELSKELENVLKAAVASLQTSKDVVSSEITQNICNVVEAIFIHGLRDPFFLKGSRYAKYPEPNFWPFVSKFSHPSITTQINALKQIRSEIGRGRAWIRVVLNESGMEHYITMLRRETTDMKRFYNDYAYLRDSEQVERMKDYLKGMLNRCAISAPTNSSLLNTWTPTPLILAGLVNGKPIRVGQLAPRRKLPSMSEHEEVGISALDLLPCPPSPIRVMNGHKISENDNDDDNASVYSHPSLLDGRGGQLRHHPQYSSTPVSPRKLDGPGGDGTSTGGAPLVESPQPLSPLLLQRRTTRPRKISRNNSNSDSDRSRSGSHSESGVVESLPTSLQIEPLLNTNTLSHTPLTVDALALPDPSALSSPATSSTHTNKREGLPSDTIDSGIDEILRDPNTSTSHSQMNSETSTEGGLGELTPNETFATEEGESERTGLDNSVFNDSESNVEVEDSTTSLGMDISHDHTNELPVGCSLQDELDSLNCVPSGNSLAGKAWSIPKAETGSDVCGSSVGMLSSSAETESGAFVSFGQALQSALTANESKLLDSSQSSKSSTVSNPCMDVQSPQSSTAELHELSPTPEVNNTVVGKTSPKTSEEQKKEKNKADDLQLLTTIAVEKGLDGQSFRCALCLRSIGAGFGKWRVCSIDALYYCSDCFSSEERLVPSRVLLNWDHCPRPVSTKGKAFVDRISDRPLIRLDVHNPKLYDHVKELRIVRDLREQLQSVALYLFSCRDTVAEDLKRRVYPCEYLLNDLHLYSMQDLVNVHSGVMQRHLSTILKFAVGHVLNCPLCRQKGFVCELCPQRDVIYPFQADTHRCPSCFSVFHRHCAKRSPCPKCARRQQYANNHSGSVEADDLQFDD